MAYIHCFLKKEGIIMQILLSKHRFFGYKDFIDYQGENYFSLTHIVLMIILTILLIMLTVLLFPLIVLPYSYYLKSKGFYPNYMLLIHRNGAVLPKIPTFFINHNMQLIYSIIIIVGYMLISFIVALIIYELVRLLFKKKRLVSS